MNTVRSLDITGLSDTNIRRMSILAAIVLHVFAGLLTIIPPDRREQPHKVASLNVDIVRLKPPDAVETDRMAVNAPSSSTNRPEPSEGEPALPVDKRVVPPAPTTPGTGGMIRAKRLFARAILQAPRNAALRADLNQTIAGERMVQICNTEVMEQVANWQDRYLPDFVVAYATDEIAISDNTVQVDGGAFRSYGAWFEIRYNCVFEAGAKDIASFEFLVGKEIPRSRWEALGLPYN